jgi:hypothetical protein
MEGLARSVDRPAALMPENAQHLAWLTYDPSVPGWIKGDMFTLPEQLDEEYTPHADRVTSPHAD